MSAWVCVCLWSKKDKRTERVYNARKRKGMDADAQNPFGQSLVTRKRYPGSADDRAEGGALYKIETLGCLSMWERCCGGPVPIVPH